MTNAAQKKILVIDDDTKLCELLKTYLLQFDMSVMAASDAVEGLSLLNKLKPDLVILDVMLPGRDGFDICRGIRRQLPTPVIMLTARGELTDRVVGLEIGADDYLSKPFEPRELVARIQSVLRRTNAPVTPAAVLRCDGLAVNTQKRAAVLKGKELDLTTTEFEILSLFLLHAGTVLSRDRILDHLRGIQCEAFNRSVDIAVSRLRKKLGDSAERPKFLKTVRGSGYLFVGKVTTHEA